MSSIWHLPKEDSPSVLSNRVYSIRRLNKMESQRLRSQINCLNAEEAQMRSLISQEQKALRKELTHIREVKSNPAVGTERRKLMQQLSSKESQTYRQPSAETQGAQQRFRSLSTGHDHICSHLPSLTNQLQRSRSTTCPPLDLGGEQPSGAFRHRKVSGTLYDINKNTSQEAWRNVTRNEKLRQRSLSTATHPRISAWVENKNDGVADSRGDIQESAYAKVHSRQCRNNVKIDFRHGLKSAWEEKTGYSYSKDNASALSCSKQMKGVVGDAAPSKLASMQRRRCYSTNSAPIISEGRVIGLVDRTTTVHAQNAGAVNQRRRCYSHSFTPKMVDREEHDDASKENNSRKEELHSIPVTSTHTQVRQRSLSTNCEGKQAVANENNNGQLNLNMNMDDKQINSLNGGTEEGKLLSKLAVGDDNFDQSQISQSDSSVSPSLVVGQDGN